MIFDTINHIVNYNEIPADVKDFILGLDADVALGRHDLSDLNYANVDMYTTKLHKDCRLEAHKKYIDIQLLLSGVERLDYTDVEQLDVVVPYDANRDVIFFETPKHRLNSVNLKVGNFVLLYPHEAHQPQMLLETPSMVKKVVVKIRV